MSKSRYNGEPLPVNRLLTTEEAAQATGLSEYELRRGAKEGRYPVLWIGSKDSSFRRMRWNLEVLQDALMQQMTQGYDGEVMR